MISFFVCTEDSVAGPFTGVELREAAMAGILRYEAIVGGGAHGPWFRAADVGLFSEKRTALPHPPGVEVASYQVRGLKGGEEGDYKLRELIGFAARGLLPADAQLRPANSSKWFPITRIKILQSTLAGELVLLDEHGAIVVRTNLQARLDAERRGRGGGSEKQKHCNSGQDQSPISPPPNSKAASRSGFVPAEVAGSAQLRHSSSPIPPPIFDEIEAAAAEAEAEKEHSKRLDELGQLERERERAQSQYSLSRTLGRVYQAMRVPLLGKRSIIPWHGVALGFAVLLLVGGLGALAAFAFRTRPTTRDLLIGSWVHDAGPEGAADSEFESRDQRFVISFRRDGRFILASASASQGRLTSAATDANKANPKIAQSDTRDESKRQSAVSRALSSWNGNFLVNPAAPRSRPLASAIGSSERIDVVSPTHSGGNVEPTDGHVELEGFLVTPPRIAGHTVTDFYVRREGDDLLVGYPAELRWRERGTVLRAGWIRLKRMEIAADLDIANELRRIKPTENLERVPYGGVLEVPHISEAVVMARAGVEIQRDGATVLRHSCMAYAEEISLWSMITRYGGPDEVRPIYEFERGSTFAELPDVTLRNGRLLRYGDLAFAFSQDGALRYVVAADSSTMRR